MYNQISAFYHNQSSNRFSANGDIEIGISRDMYVLANNRFAVELLKKP